MKMIHELTDEEIWDVCNKQGPLQYKEDFIALARAVLDAAWIKQQEDIGQNVKTS